MKTTRRQNLIIAAALMAQAKKNGWTVIRMKNEWKRIFAWEQ
jgi:hypothetical protein